MNGCRWCGGWVEVGSAGSWSLLRTLSGAAVIEELARERLGFERLRPGQLRAAEALAGGRDVLAVLPAGGGKAAIYQLAGDVGGGADGGCLAPIALPDDALGPLAPATLPGGRVHVP